MREARQPSTMGKKMKQSTRPRKIGNHVTRADKGWAVRSALVNIRRKALGHLTTFTQRRLKYT